MNNKLSTITNLFEGKEIRSIWDSEKEDYYFSVVDVIAALTDATIPRNYWSDLKRKLIDEGSEVHEKIVQLKLKAKDGKMRETDTLDTEGIFRLIESVPSSKAEPFKTINEAKAYVQGLISSGMTGDVYVYIAEGTYNEALEYTIDRIKNYYDPMRIQLRESIKNYAIENFSEQV